MGVAFLPACRVPASDAAAATAYRLAQTGGRRGRDRRVAGGHRG